MTTDAYQLDNTIATRRGWRDEPLEVIEGELYEVWLHHDWEEPKPCVPVVRIATDAISPNSNWEVLVDGEVKEVHAGQIFRPGTATRPEVPFFIKMSKMSQPGISTLSISDIVTVQPMTMPTTSVFYMDYKYGKAEK